MPSLLVSVINPWLPYGLFCNLRSTRLRRELDSLLVLLSYRLQQRSLLCLADLLARTPQRICSTSSKPSCHQPSTASQDPRLTSTVAGIPWVDNSSHSARLALAVFKLGYVFNDLGGRQGSRSVVCFLVYFLMPWLDPTISLAKNSLNI